MKNKKKIMLLSFITFYSILTLSDKKYHLEEPQVVDVFPDIGYNVETIVDTPTQSNGIIQYEEIAKVEEPIKNEKPIINYEPNMIDNYGFVRHNTLVYNSFNENKYVIDNIEEYQKVYILSENNGFYTVPTKSGIIGYVNINDIELLPKEFIEVDISDQLTAVYNNNEKVLEASVVTGKSGNDTNIGYQEILEKTYNRALVGPTWNVDVNYFFPFNYDGEGFHDASWRNEFGGDIYINNGSHGCVNMNIDDVSKMDEYIEVGTKVLIHK